MPEIKGSAVRESIVSYTTRPDGDYQRLLARLDPATRQLFLDPIVSNGWFPLDAFTRFLEAIVVDSGEPPEQLVLRSERVVEQQLRGIYRVFAMLMSAGSVVAKITAINSTYFRGVRVERTPVGDHGASMRYEGFSPQHRLMEFIIVGFYRKALEICGAKRVHAEWVIPISAGQAHAELKITWE